MDSSSDVVAIVPSAGSGMRLGREKPYVKLGGRPMIVSTLAALSGSKLIKEIILLVKKDKVGFARSLVRRYRLDKVTKVAAGGSTRTHSVYNGLKAARARAGYILIHDGARPFVSKKLIQDCIKGAQTADGAVCALPVSPTVKRADAKGLVVETLERNGLWAVQTPQVFKNNIIVSAYRHAIKDKAYATDDAALVERLGGKVRVVRGDHENIKITVPEDLVFAEAIVARRDRIRHTQA